MNKKDLIKHLERMPDDAEVVVVLRQPGVGGTPSTNIENISSGIDWDNGKIMLHTAIPVVTEEHLARIQKYCRRYEKLLYLYAMENNLEFMGKPLMGSRSYPKGAFVRATKQMMKDDVEEYLNPK